MRILRSGLVSLALGGLIAGCGESAPTTEMNAGTAQEGIDAAKSGLAQPTDPTKKTATPAPAPDAKK